MEFLGIELDENKCLNSNGKEDVVSFKTSKLVKNEIGKKLENLGLLHASKACGFVKRKGRKISPSTLIGLLKLTPIRKSE